MNFALIVISLALVFVLTSADGDYQYLLFVQQWPKSVCYDFKCTKAPPPVFTTHGLWPANYSGASLTCKGVGFDEKLMNQQTVLKKNLEQKSWPDVLRGNHMDFWKHEWTAHGRCCDSVFPQTQYFEWCNKKWGEKVIGDILKKSLIIPDASKKYSLSAIENAIRANTGHTPYIRCVNSKKAGSFILTEVVICYDYHGTMVVDCKPKSNCPATNILYPN